MRTRVTQLGLGSLMMVVLGMLASRADLLAELEVRSMSDLSEVLERVRLIKGIRSTETSIHLATYR